MATQAFARTETTEELGEYAQQHDSGEEVDVVAEIWWIAGHGFQQLHGRLGFDVHGFLEHGDLYGLCCLVL